MYKLKLVLSVILFLFILTYPKSVYARAENFVTLVNPIRGEEFWENKGQDPNDAVAKEMNVLKKYNLPATWLIRFDALSSQSIVGELRNKPVNHEIGLFLEITPSLAKTSGVQYYNSKSWHSAGSVFLTGYLPSDREKLIDAAFNRFKSTFGFFPQSVGAWWIDSHSLEYMQGKYGITASLEVADQYSTDDYQIWGQYFATPYYSVKNNALIPAQDPKGKIPVVILQWASRDPVNGYGNGVEESTYSVQANDYLDYHNLSTDYFGNLVDLYMKQPFNRFNQLTVGLENSYALDKYQNEYENQIKALIERRDKGQLTLDSMNQFATWYSNTFPDISPPQVIIANDPLGTSRKTVWFMDTYYRAGWFYDSNGSNFRDIRQYVYNSTELCLTQACNSLNFATSATRVLDDVSFSQRWEIDQGTITNFGVDQTNQGFKINYVNAAGKATAIEFLPRDLSVDGKISTIDGTILDATKHALVQVKTLYPLDAKGTLKSSVTEEIINLMKFILFVFFGIFIPGSVLINHSTNNQENAKSTQPFLSIAGGMVFLTLSAYILGFIHAWWGVGILILLSTVIYVKNGLQSRLKISKVNPWAILIIILGSLFQLIPTVKSGLLYDFGVGYWGPNGHDAIWHLSLINQVLNGLPPQNPIFGGESLKNYHYFFDILLAISYNFTKIPLTDLLFRFYPFTFSVLIGLGSYLFVRRLFKSEKAAVFSLYFIYFAGSFGWIVEFIKERHFGGESAFWANQAVSLNLNPPFSISLVFVLAVLSLLFEIEKNRSRRLILLLVLLIGSLIEFKAYAGILVLGSLGIVGLHQLIIEKKIFYLKLFLLSLFLSLFIFLPNVTKDQLLVYSPLWLVNSMIDFPDRVGWVRLSNARIAYLQREEWIKFYLTEGLSLMIFLVGNLGVRIMGVIAAFKLKRIAPFQIFYFILSLLLFSLTIPLLFIQSGTNWNIVQFFYYFMFILSLLAGAMLEKMYSARIKPLGKLVALVLLIITPINSVVTASTYFVSKPHAFISMEEYAGLTFLAKQENGKVLTYPFEQRSHDKISDPRPLFAYYPTAYVSAYSQKPSFLEDSAQNDILRTPYLGRTVEIKDFFERSSSLAQRTFLRKNKISYLYLPRYYQVPIDEQALGVKKIFEGKDVFVYKIIY